MTRDEARIKYKLQFERDITIALNVARSFENRTCENCINDYQYDIQDRLELEDYSLNFGCTFFREKETK